MDLSKIVCVTTFRQGDPENAIENTRSKVFLDTAREAQNAGLTLVATYIETRGLVLETLRELGVILVKQQSMGMGNIRREALAGAYDNYPNAQYVCWVEPEKPGLVEYIVPMAHQMEREQSNLGIFNRNDMTSYPPEQAHYYLFCRAVATQLIGFDFDYAFGPMMITHWSAPYFLEYQGEYGDKWDSILIPRLRIIRDRQKISVFSTDFQNDARMTSVESGNPTIILKRIEQLNNVVPSLIAEWQRLGKP